MVDGKAGSADFDPYLGAPGGRTLGSGERGFRRTGDYIDWPIRCGFLAGLVNGSLLAVIAVATASERFQAGTTGLLGGLSLSALRSDGSMVWKAKQGLHGFVDNAFRAMGIELNEKLHHAIEQETLYMLWTIVFVVMASLVAEWVRSSRAQTDRER